MRKIEIGVLCIALCIAGALFLPQVGVSYPTVDDTVCFECHGGGNAFPDGEIHSVTSHTDCTTCHEVTGDTPTTSKCVKCHPHSTSPGKCNLVNFHEGEPDYMPAGDSCLDCHDTECGTTGDSTTTTADADTTTTTADADTTTTSAICASQEIYGINSAEVQILRFVRDNILAASPEGREIIRLYYQLSPVIVAAMQNDPAFKAEVKAMSDGVLQLVVQ